MTLTAPISEGVVYYVRVRPATATFYSDTGTIAWASTGRVAPLQVFASDVDATPGWLTVTVSNGTPGGTVDFAIDGGMAIFGTSLDELGQIIGTAIPLGALGVGSHLLRVSTPTLEGFATFNVLNPTPAYPITAPVDTGPVPIALGEGVTKWALQDAILGGAQYVFPISPSKMSNPHSARVFTTVPTVAANGQPLVFEGFPVGVDWTIEGTVRTQDFHDQLETFLAMPRRLYLIDHLSRAWTVSLESIAWTRLPEAYNDWAFTYQLKAIIYAGPVQTHPERWT